MRLNKILLIGALTATLATLTNGCAYRYDLDQGNFVEQEAVNKLRQGMTDDQVRFILGTPMLTDPLDNSRWYYTQLHRQGWNDPEIKTLIAIFQGRTLVDIHGDFEKPAEFNSGVNSVQKISSEDMVIAPANSQQFFQCLRAINS